METQLTVPRLIDANALKERMNSDFWSNAADLVDALEIIDSAPTVETTDDVLARIPKFPQRTDYQCLIFDRGNWIFSNAEFKDNVYILRDFAYGRTPLEAVTRLEAALRA